VPLHRRAHGSSRTERVAQHRQLLLDRPEPPPRHAAVLHQVSGARKAPHLKPRHSIMIRGQPLLQTLKVRPITVSFHLLRIFQFCVSPAGDRAVSPHGKSSGELRTGQVDAASRASSHSASVAIEIDGAALNFA
jgi:hypothetical protein